MSAIIKFATFFISLLLFTFLPPSVSSLSHPRDNRTLIALAAPSIWYNILELSLITAFLQGCELR
jgi:hypothetical protein